MRCHTQGSLFVGHILGTYCSLVIRCLQIQKAMGNPFANGVMPRLEYVLLGIKRVESQAGPPQQSETPSKIQGKRISTLRAPAVPELRSCAALP